LDTYFRRAFETGLRHGRGRVALRNHISKPVRLLGAARIAEELIDVMEPGPGENPLVAHMAEAAQQVAQEIDLDLVRWREVGMTALGGKWPKTSIRFRQQAGFSKAGTSGNQRSISSANRNSRVERHQIRFGQQDNSMRVGFEIINQRNG